MNKHELQRSFARAEKIFAKAEKLKKQASTHEEKMKTGLLYISAQLHSISVFSEAFLAVLMALQETLKDFDENEGENAVH